MAEFSNDELKMSVSPICMDKQGKKMAYVLFTDGRRSAEGKIPDCVITSNSGFTEEEKVKLELYLKSNLTQLKKMAAGVDVFSAVMKDKEV
ncbi:MAG: hypothetical protein K6B75_08000 [Lachnospiraceae bacterium]|nr:hypothetical protein [Lachnospiraceae bacterium]